MESPRHPHFPVYRCAVRDGLALGYWRAGEGGLPLLLVHGFPETKRIWVRNVAPLAAVGFDVIVPDLRGVGDSDPAPDGFYDPPAYARDLRVLCEELGLARCGAAAGDVGAAVVAELGLRFPGFVERQCLFNTLAPPLTAAFAAAGIPEDPPPHERPEMDYFVRQGSDGDGLLAELDTPAKRRAYVGGMYAERCWAAPGAFTREDVAYHSEPFGSAEALRAAIAVYGVGFGKRPMSEPPVLAQINPVRTLILYGPEDRVVTRHFPARMAVAFPDHAGPFEIAGSGHFVSWEQPAALHDHLRAFFHDLL
ncbi:MAG TPA: alpha/beta hydrolase [Myxococcota bacterium]|nr:alpha/beta hydrolase [Myxococcota bacterium]